MFGRGNLEMAQLIKQREAWRRALGEVIATAPEDHPIRSSGTTESAVFYFMELHAERDRYKKDVETMMRANCALSERLYLRSANDQITHLFGLPLDEIHDIINRDRIQQEKRAVVIAALEAAAQQLKEIDNEDT